MFPQVSSVFFNWSEAVQMKIIDSTPVNFEAKNKVVAVVDVEMVLQAMSARKVDRKPEGERIWKWWTGWTTTRVTKGMVLQDPDGIEYRVDDDKDWSQGGFYEVDLVQQPRGLGK